MIKKIKNLFKRDDGYSLLEISLATGIMVIGFSVAAPALNNAISDASENATRTNLYQASLIIEEQRYQNEGAYPTIMPQELTANAEMADFRYTYSDDQMVYCLMGRDSTGQKWFMGNQSTEPYMPSATEPGCTQDNLGSGSKALGEAPVLIPAEVSGSNTWDFGTYDYSLANVSWSGASCTPSTTDPDPGTVQRVEYQVRVVNTSSGEIVEGQNGDWILGTSMNSIALTDWIPNDDISYQVRMRCTYDYETYYDSWNSTNDKVDEFPVQASLVKRVPEPNMTWTYAQEFPVLSYSGTEITCPLIASPRYRAVVTQGDKTITFGWISAPEYNNLSLTNFVPREGVYIVSEASCKINNTYFVANSAPPSDINPSDVYNPGDSGGTGEREIGPFMPPEPPPAAIMGIHCVTKYERINEASKGDCVYDANIAESTYVPNAVHWGSPGCLPEYNIEYQIRRSAPNATGWVSTGSTPKYNIGADTVAPGQQVTYEVKGRCIHIASGTSSDFSQVASTSFRTSWKPSTDDPMEIVWTPSTLGSSWVFDGQQGSGYLYDRVTAAPTTTCQNGTVPSGYRFWVSSDNGATWIVSPTQTSPFINREALSGQADTYWPMGLSIKTKAQTICSDPLGDYPDVVTSVDKLTNASWSDTIELGYSAPTEVTGFNCVTKYQRATEATRGGCAYDATVEAQRYTPDLLKWNEGICQVGYTPHYYIRSVEMDGRINAWADATNLKQWVPAKSNVDYKNASNISLLDSSNVQTPRYDVKYVCENASNGKYSADSNIATKTFQLSNKPSTVTTVNMSWTPSTADTSWSTTEAQNGNYLYDSIAASPTMTCTNNTYPVGYSAKVGREGKGTYSTLSFTTKDFNVNRSAVATPDNFWMQGSKIVLQAQATCADPNGDYPNQAQNWTALSSPIVIGAVAPAAPPSPANNGWRKFSWASPSCAAVDGATVQYYSRQSRHGNTYNSWLARDWSTETNVDAPEYNQGYPLAMHVKARCVSSYGVISAESAEATSAWTSAINPPANVSWYFAGNKKWYYTDWGGCPAGSTPAPRSYQVAWNTSGGVVSQNWIGQVNQEWYWVANYSGTANNWASFEAWFYVKCVTPWAQSSERVDGAIADWCIFWDGNYWNGADYIIGAWDDCVAPFYTGHYNGAHSHNPG